MWRVTLFVLLSCALLAGTLVAQDAAVKTEPLSNRDVLEMLNAGLTPEIVIAKIETSKCDFDTSPATLRELKAANVPEAVILAMVQAPLKTPRAESVVSDRQASPSSLETAYVECGIGGSQVSLNSAPAISSAVAEMNCGDKISVIGSQSEGSGPYAVVWYKVRTENGTEGYIPLQFVSDSSHRQIAPEPSHASEAASEHVTALSAADYGTEKCTRAISFALADASGVRPFMGTGNWIESWVRKNAKKHPDVCFSQSPMRGRTNYLIVLSQSAAYYSGIDPVVRTDTSTNTTPVSGSGTVTDNYGGMWNYTYNGTVTTTTTTTTQEDVPYTINSNTLYANAYNGNGTLVSHRYHVYSTKSGGDPYNSAGYNLGNALGAINARGHLLSTVVKDIEGKR